MDNTVLLKNNLQGIMPTTTLSSLVIKNTLVSDVCMEYVADMKCELHHINLEKYLVQPKHYQNFRYLC